MLIGDIGGRSGGGARTESQRPERGRDGEEQEGLHRADDPLEAGSRRGRTGPVAGARFPRSPRSSFSVGLRRQGDGAGPGRNGRDRRHRLAQEYRIPFGLSRSASGHQMVLGRHRAVHQ